MTALACLMLGLVMLTAVAALAGKGPPEDETPPFDEVAAFERAIGVLEELDQIPDHGLDEPATVIAEALRTAYREGVDLGISLGLSARCYDVEMVP